MQNLRNRLPLMFAVSFAIAIALLAYQKLAAWHGSMFVAGCVFLASYVLWLLLESRVALTETKKGETRVDRGTCEAYALGRALVVLSALALPTTWSEPGMWMFAGFGVGVV